MKIKSRRKTLLAIITLLIEIAILVSVFILNHLTATKGGIMKHIYSRRIQYEQGIYSKDLLLKQSVIAILFAVIFAGLLIYTIRNHKNLLLKMELIISILVSLFIPIVINSEFFIDMLSYPYFIMVSEIILLIQIMMVIFLAKKENVYSNKNK